MTSSSTNSGVRQHHRDVRRHARSGPGAGRRAEPRQPGARPPARPKCGRPASRSRSRRPASSWRSGVYAEKGEYDSLFLSNYIDVYVKDALKRVPGVGDVTIFGERKYSMRPVARSRSPGRARSSPPATSSTRCASRTSRSRRAASGRRRPRRADVPAQRARASGACARRREFDNIIVKSGADGSLVRLKDVGRAELGAETYAAQLRFQGVEAVGFGVIQLPSANALDVERAVVAELDRLAKQFPAGRQVPGRLRHDRRRRGIDPRGR